MIVVQPGEKIPIDGIIEEGTSTLNTSALTGESLPRDAKAGEEVISGCINMTRRAENPHHQRIRRIHRFQDPGSCGKFQFQEIQIRELYFQIRKILHPCSLLQCTCTCNHSASLQNAVYGTFPGVGRLDLPCPYLPGNQLPMCTGHQYSS